jgi:hypothetical protein
MISDEILNKQIGDFVDNDIDSYRSTEEILFQKFLLMYLEKNGFFVIHNENKKPLKYLDTFDISQLKKIFDEMNNNNSSILETIKLLDLSDKLKYRDEFVNYTDTIKSVLLKFQNNNQIFYPVIKEGYLVGRVSKEIIKNKINRLYNCDID